MHRAGYYILLFAIVALLQTFFFNHLTLWSCFAPMGVTMDLTMGTAGLNTISTLAVAYLRRPILDLILGSEIVRDGGIPTLLRMGQRQFVQYLIIVVVLHSVIFFGMEAFTTAYLWYQLLRLVVSASASILFVWLIMMLFTPKHASR